jgi:membrane-associated phospholipid phosphatase
MSTTAPQVSLPKRLADTVAVGSLASGSYMIAGAFVAPSRAPLHTPLDAWTPFVPEAIWLYMPGYALCFALVVGLVREARRWRASLLSFGAVSGLALPFFVLLPIAAPRADPHAAASVSGAMVALLYAHDPAVNTFPSLHVANAVLCAGIVAGTRPRYARGAWGLALGIAVSVLLLKQHWAVDVPAGAALGALGLGMWRTLASGAGQRTTTNRTPVTAAAPKAP